MASRCPTTALSAVRWLPQFVTRQQTRCLTLHEYQSQKMLKEFDIPTPRCGFVKHINELYHLMSFEKIEVPLILRPQVLRKDKGRMVFRGGLTGNGTIAKNKFEARAALKKMVSHRLRMQNWPATEEVLDDRVQFAAAKLPSAKEEVLVKVVYVSEVLELMDEWYLAVTIDRETCAPVILVSEHGGCDIEQIMEDNPESLVKYPVRRSEGIRVDLVRRIAEQLEIPTAQEHQLDSILRGLWEIFVEKDATHLEINPLARLLDDELTCVSSCFIFDDAALSKHYTLKALRDVDQAVTEEVEAEMYGLNYVKMSGNIGTVVNGAGLAMATNDAITEFKGESANFLDIGGHCGDESMTKALEIILRDEKLKVIWVNIYGGTTDCTKVAQSLISAVSKLGPLEVPVVVRMQGMNSHRAYEMLKKANLNLHLTDDFRLAAKRAVRMARNL